MDDPLDGPQGSLPRGSGLLIGAGVFVAIGLGIGIVLVVLAYVPASPWELPAALLPFLVGAGLTWSGMRRYANLRGSGLDRYPGLLRWLLGACTVLVCVIVSSGLVNAAAVAMIGNTQWAALIAILPFAGPMAIYSYYSGIHARNLRQALEEMTAELEQEVREHSNTHEGDAHHDGDDAT